jgi:hypothetical protein
MLFLAPFDLIVVVDDLPNLRDEALFTLDELSAGTIRCQAEPSAPACKRERHGVASVHAKSKSLTLISKRHESAT